MSSASVALDSVAVSVSSVASKVEASVLSSLTSVERFISIYRELLELLLLQPDAMPAVATNVTALAISATGVLPVLEILSTSNADTTPVT